MSQTQPRPAQVTREESGRAMRAFMACGACWGIWGRLLSAGSPVFVAYLLSLGLRQEDMSLVLAVATLMGLAQIFTSSLGQRVRNKKRLVFWGGTAEMLFPAGLIVLAAVRPLTPGSLLAITLAAVALGALGAGFAGPTFSMWFGALVPEKVRGRFMSHRLLLVCGVGVLVGTASMWALGEVKDTPWDLPLFAALLLLGCVTGVAGYLFIARIPIPPVKETPALHPGQVFLLPFRHAGFGLLLVFYGLWMGAIMMPAANYTVFQLEILDIPRAQVGIFNAISLAVLAGGYFLGGLFVDRFGSKPLIQMSAMLTVTTPILFLVCTPERIWPIYIAVVLSSFAISAGGLACSTLLFKAVPQGEDNTPFFGAHAAGMCLGASAGMFLGRGLLALFKDAQWQIPGLPTDHFRRLFLVSSAVGLAPLVAAVFLSEDRAATTGQAVRHLTRGNFFRYAYNYLIYFGAGNVARRSRAAVGMGRSRSPMALDTLTAALEDPHPEIRSSAAYALGEMQSPDAVAPLADKLTDDESDVRMEAAQALGKLRHGLGIESLFRSLDDGDPRVRISAIGALADIGGPDVIERLRGELAKPFDRLVFPSLVEALSHQEDPAVVAPALESLDRFQRTVMRLQVLNCVCRALGAANRFYRFTSAEDLRRSSQMRRLLERAERATGRLEIHAAAPAAAAAEQLANAARAFAGEDFEAACDALWLCGAALDECGTALEGEEARLAGCRRALQLTGPRESVPLDAETRAIFLACIVERVLTCMERTPAR